jgi:hypothetical protein
MVVFGFSTLTEGIYQGGTEDTEKNWGKSRETRVKSWGPATLDRYRKRYPTRQKMGRLALSGLEITPLGDAAALGNRPVEARPTETVIPANAGI